MNRLIIPGDTQGIDTLLRDHPDIQYLDAFFFDLCGFARGKRYPRRDALKVFEDGMTLPYPAYLLDVTGDSCDPGGQGFSDGDPDGIALPVAGTLARVPWAAVPSAQVMLGMLAPDGSPLPTDPRHVLCRVLERFAASDLTPVVAVELEFYLIDPERGPGGEPLAPVSPVSGRREAANQVYSIDGLDAFAPVLRAMDEAARALNLPATAASTEFAPRQFEINLHHVADPLLAADHGMLLRRLVKQVARQHGLDATFMSKPFPDNTGNGLHLHISLQDASGRNLFSEGEITGNPWLRRAIGGLAATLDGAMALFAPNINAFRRFQPDQFVPVNRSWTVNNRSGAFRIPAGGASARRIEHRVAGAEANCYLVLAAILAGIHHGIEQGLDPGEPATGNAGHQVDPTLPLDWSSAIAGLRDSEVLADYLGAEYLSLYCETKRGELEKFQRTISPQEYQWYL